VAENQDLRFTPRAGPQQPNERATQQSEQLNHQPTASPDSLQVRQIRVSDKDKPDPVTLKRWLAGWTSVRHREAAERTLLTAIAAGASPAMLADALLAAATERAFADTGHSLDFINKAFECLDLIG